MTKVIDLELKRRNRNKKAIKIPHLYFEVLMEPEELNLFAKCIEQRKQDIYLLNCLAGKERKQDINSIEDNKDVLMTIETFENSIEVYRVLVYLELYKGPFKLILHVYELDYFTSLIFLQHSIYKANGNEALSAKLKLLMNKTAPYYKKYKTIIDKFFSIYTDKQRIFLLHKARTMDLNKGMYY